jgi:hypothetical protein
MAYSALDGEMLVSAARHSLELYLRSPGFDGKAVERMLEGYTERRGVFVTISHYPTMTVRGIAGFPDERQLGKQIVAATIEAATANRKLVPVSHLELGDCIVGVGIISSTTRMKERTWKGRLNAFAATKEGILVRYGMNSGMMLPRVALEGGLTKKEALEHICYEAGLHKDSWRRPEIDLYKFSAQVFREEEPMGRISELR